MNTFRICEDLRARLGEDVAKSLAHTLGPMFDELDETATKADVQEPNATVGRLAGAQELTQSHAVALTQAQERTEARMAALIHIVETLSLNGNRMATRLDTVLGRTLELQFRDRLTSYLGRFMRRGRLVRNDELPEAIEPLVDAEDANEILRADAIATGVIEGAPGHVVVEVSATCGADHVDRAERRAGILRTAGLMAVPLVACEVVAREQVAYARSRQVRVWCNGTMIDAAA